MHVIARTWRASSIGALALICVGFCVCFTGCGNVEPAALAAIDERGADTGEQAGKESQDKPMDDHPFARRSPAPSLDGGAGWINTAEPIDLKDLRGKFVLLDF